MKTLPRNIFQRLLGISATKKPSDDSAWGYAEGVLAIDLSKLPELDKPGNAVRIEGDTLPTRVLVLYGDDMTYYAFENKCQHAGRRLDPVPGTETVQCCSMGHTTYTYDGSSLSESVEGSLKIFNVELKEGMLTIKIE